MHDLHSAQNLAIARCFFVLFFFSAEGSVEMYQELVRAQLLSFTLIFLFSDVLIAVAVVVFLNSVLKLFKLSHNCVHNGVEVSVLSAQVSRIFMPIHT